MRADAMLDPARDAALDRHLLKCPKCAAARDADVAMREALRISLYRPPSDSGEFALAVISRLRAPQAAPAAWLVKLRACAPFLNQTATGAFVAASLAGFMLLANLNGSVKASATRGGRAHVQRSPQVAPAPLSSLLQSDTPRAAMIWSASPQPAADHRATQPGSASPRSGRNGVSADHRHIS